MEHPKALAVLLVVALGTGCTSLMSTLDRPFRKPGEHLKAFPEKVWKQYDCEKQTLPFFSIELLDLSPRRLKPGEQFKQRLIYSLCTQGSTGVVTGKLDTRIMHRGSPVVHEQDPQYDLKPGRWVIDSFVRLPEEAAVGVYAFEFEFHSKSVEFEKIMNFVVEADGE
jgi:hypothetical protein